MEKSINEFGKRAHLKDGLSYYCKLCWREKLKILGKRWYQKNKEKAKLQRLQYTIDNAERVKEYKKQYRKDHSDKVKEKAKTYRNKNPDKIKGKAFSKYWPNLTPDERVRKYNEILNEQNGVCAICGKPETSVIEKTGTLRNLAVDHDHETGEVRGLLCGRCNRGFGYFNEDVDIIVKLLEYAKLSLEKQQEKGK